jgi:hypothetical protein
MKKNLLALTFTSILALNSYSQTIPNNSFETWTNGITPDGWVNEYAQPTQTMTQATPAFDGSLAFKVSVFHVTASNTDEWAYVTSRFGISPATQPQKLTFYYKANIVAGDLSKIYLNLFDNGTPVGTATYVFNPQTLNPNYQFGEATINYSSGAIPDSAEIIIIGGDAENAAQKDGTYLIIDKIEFDGVNLVLSNHALNSNALSVNVYPNPAKDLITLSMDHIQSGETSIKIFNVLGKECLSYKFPESVSTAREHKIDVTNLPAGVYLIKGEQGNENFQKKLIIQ